VQDVEEAVAVGRCEALVAVLVDERHDLVDTIEIPALARGGLEVPLDLAVCRIDAETRCGIEVVTLVAVDRLAGAAQVAVPGRGVASAENERLGVLVIGTAEPGRAAAGLPHVTRPGRVQRPGHGAFLAVEGAHMAFDDGAAPDEFAGLGVACLYFADNAEFTAGVAGDDEAVNDQRSGGTAVAFLVVGELLVPDAIAGLAVQRHEACIEGTEIDVGAEYRRTAVDHVATGKDAFRKTCVVLPDFLAGLD